MHRSDGTMKPDDAYSGVLRVVLEQLKRDAQCVLRDAAVSAQWFCAGGVWTPPPSVPRGSGDPLEPKNLPIASPEC